MSLPSIAAIACGNGLGHIRRVVAVLDVMRDRVGSVRLFAPEERLSRLTGWGPWTRIAATIELLDFDTQAWAPAAWTAVIPKLVEQIVWCDNLPEILEIRPDAVLSGSFFWHEVAKAAGRSDSYVGRCRELLEHYRPAMAGHEAFATRDVRELTTFAPVGLYRFHTATSTRSSTGLLVSAGASGEGRSAVAEAIEALDETRTHDAFEAVWVEPECLPDPQPRWIRRATFDEGMFASIGAACIRPGMGTISDVLVTGGRLFPIAATGFEMEHNASVIESTGVGETRGSTVEALTRAAEYVSDEAARQRHAVAVGSMRRDGVEATAGVILGALATGSGRR